jgi:hypothetical protein
MPKYRLGIAALAALAAGLALALPAAAAAAQGSGCIAVPRTWRMCSSRSTPPAAAVTTSRS